MYTYTHTYTYHLCVYTSLSLYIYIYVLLSLGALGDMFARSSEIGCTFQTKGRMRERVPDKKNSNN